MSTSRDDLPSGDADHPWIGLASFTESSRGFFHGREDEIAELCRRIQRKPLTVLFGKSGLGKTSILQAGVVPRLRDQGYCPVYLRIDYAAGAPSAVEQIKQAIFKAAESREDVADDGESLWAFLHHRDDVLLDAQGRPLLPLLIFDQFEEIFTLAQGDQQGRDRAASFAADLADLVENRPPADLEALLEDEDGAFERYDLARADYRVVISLREDYLAHLEGLKAAMPSITQNRLRLAPMSGTQALAAVTEPGRRLVNDEVAAAIVRFVAGGAEVAHAEVEPSLLSLICRELNDQRIALGRAEIGADLLAGSHTSILGEFYERSLVDQPAGVRAFIEDQLLTGSGYRENAAEERVRSEFAAAGAAPDTLATLVNRRLLRIEERLDLRRVELTHDVLGPVVRASRDARREREALDASERLAAKQAERAHLAQRALQRARGVAAVCILLTVGAIAASGFAVVSSRRAERAQRDAEATRLRAEQLLGYLQNDFATQLIPLGRLDLVRSLNDQLVAYFNGVPIDQRTSEWAHSRALALLAQAETRVFQGKELTDATSLDTALEVLASRNSHGSQSDVDLTELGRAISTRADWLMWGTNDRNGALSLDERAAALLDRAAETTHSSVATRMIQARISQRICYLKGEIRVGDPTTASASCELARRQYAAMGALDGSNPVATAQYMKSSWALMAALDDRQRSEDALQVGEEAMRLAAPLIAEYPAYSSARQAIAQINARIGDIYIGKMDLAKAGERFDEAERELSTLTRTDSSVANMWNDLGFTRYLQGIVELQRGRPDQAAERWNASIDAYRSAPQTNFVLRNGLLDASSLAIVDADLGDARGREAAVSRWRDFGSTLQQLYTKTSVDGAFLKCREAALNAQLAEMADDPVAARRVGTAGLADADRSMEESLHRSACLSDLSWTLGQAQYRTGDAVGAEAAFRRALDPDGPYAMQRWDDLRRTASVSTWLALAQIRQGRLADARKTLAPVLTLHRGLERLGTRGALQRLEMGAALYAQALAEETPAARRRLLDEAAALVDALPATMHPLHSFQLWRDRIADARGGRDAWPPQVAAHR